MKTNLLFIMAAFLLLAGCENNNNIFSWAHTGGSDLSSAALFADAQKAEDGGDYDQALEYYDKLLENDPDNSQALYGKASAELKNAGLDIADLMSKALSGDSSGTEDLIEGIDFKQLAAGSREAKEALAKIVSGKGDGAIPADDPDVNLNLAVTRIVYVVSYLIDTYSVDIKGDFSVDSSVRPVSPGDKTMAVDEIDEAIKNLDNSGIDAADIKKSFEDFRTSINNL